MMTLTILRSTDKLIFRLSFHMGLSVVSLMIVLLVWVNDDNFDHLTEVVFVKFLYCQVTHLPPPSILVLETKIWALSVLVAHLYLYVILYVYLNLY